MIQIFPPQNFKKIPWKNGQGITTELAINTGGTLNDFDWRISIASVIEDGLFSNFSGYLRNLILIQGNGIKLNHDNHTTDVLENILDLATFDGSSQTIGTLINGPIKDFNIMTNKENYVTEIETIKQNNNIRLKQSSVCFIYSLNNEATITFSNNTKGKRVPQGYLAQLTNYDKHTQVTGDKLLVIYLRRKQ